MAHVESFLRGNRAALRKIEAPDDTPFQIQILTGGEDNLKRLLEGFTPLPIVGLVPGNGGPPFSSLCVDRVLQRGVSLRIIAFIEDPASCAPSQGRYVP